MAVIPFPREFTKEYHKDEEKLSASFEKVAELVARSSEFGKVRNLLKKLDQDGYCGEVEFVDEQGKSVIIRLEVLAD